MVKRLEYKSNSGFKFNIFYRDTKVIGFEYEPGVDSAQLRTLESYHFVSLEQMKSTINKVIPCQMI